MTGTQACVCEIEDNLITAALDPSSFINLCTGTYTDCPTWRRDKQRIWESQNKSLLDLMDADPDSAQTAPGAEFR